MFKKMKKKGYTWYCFHFKSKYVEKNKLCCLYKGSKKYLFKEFMLIIQVAILFAPIWKLKNVLIITKVSFKNIHEANT